MSIPQPLNAGSFKPTRPVVAAPAVAAPPQQAKALTPKTTRGKVNYIEPSKNGEELYVHLYELPEGASPSNLERVEKEITVTDVRPTAKDKTLKRNGFELHHLEVPDDIEWQNQREVEERYYPHAEALLKRATGATRVHVFDHTLRYGRIPPSDTTLENVIRERNKPVGMVHVDYTAAGGHRRLHMLLPEEAEKLEKTPFAIIQVWRPLKGPVQSSPLGVIDAETVKKDDLVSYRLEFPGRTGFNYAVKYSPDHRWYYADKIETDEAYVFVCYDSRTDRARFTPHTGFTDLGSAPDAPQRESVELRSICFFEDLPPQDVAKEL